MVSGMIFWVDWLNDPIIIQRLHSTFMDWQPDAMSQAGTHVALHCGTCGGFLTWTAEVVAQSQRLYNLHKVERVRATSPPYLAGDFCECKDNTISHTNNSNC
jgi:hypothetical protein